MTLKIENYTIESQKGFEALESNGIKTDNELKKIDKNGDKIISDQELEDAQIETDIPEDEQPNAADDSEEAAASDKSDSSSGSMTEIEALKKSIESLEETLITLLNKANTAADIEQLDSILSSVETTINTLSTENASLIKLLSGSGTTNS